MKGFFTSFILFITFHAYTQDYRISFSGTGASSTVETVKVENLTQGKSKTLNGNDILLLRQYLTGIEDIEMNNSNLIKIFPNPVIDYSYVSFNLPKSSQVGMGLYDLSGRCILQRMDILSSGINSYRIGGLNHGIYLVRISYDKYNISGKLVSINSDEGIPFSKVDHNNHIQLPVSLRSTLMNVEMQYNEGDRLKITGISGKHKTVVMDTPSANKTIKFEFISCIDPDGRGYEIVKIGNQWWMAENLGYLPYVNPISLGSWTNEKKYFVIDYNSNDLSKALASENYAKYGVLYNWYSAMNSSNGSSTNPSGIQGTCPSGWHLPSDAEWKILELNIGMKQEETDLSGGFRGELSESLMSNEGWKFERNGNDNFGFSAEPAGYILYEGRSSAKTEDAYWWTTSDNGNQAFSRRIGIFSKGIGRNYTFKGNGLSIRCIKD